MSKKKKRKRKSEKCELCWRCWAHSSKNEESKSNNRHSFSVGKWPLEGKTNWQLKCENNCFEFEEEAHTNCNGNMFVGFVSIKWVQLSTTINYKHSLKIQIHMLISLKLWI